MYSKEQYMEKLKSREANVADLFLYFFSKWKKIVSLSIVLFVVITAILIVKGIIGRKNIDSDLDDASFVAKEQLTESQQKKVNSILDLYKEIDELEKYKNSLAIMQVDAFGGKVETIQYYISSASEKTEYSAYELYASFVQSGALKARLEEEIGDKIKNPADLISLENVLDEESENSNYNKKVLTLKINASDDELNKEMADIIKKEIVGYKKEVVDKLLGEHNLSIISENSYSEIVDSVVKKQKNFDTVLSDKTTQLRTLESQLTNEEKSVLEYEISDHKSVNSKEKVDNEPVISLKLLIIAIVLGVFIAIVVFGMSYLLDNTVQKSNEITEIFDLPYVEINEQESDKKIQEIKKTEIDLICKTQNVDKVFVSCLTSVQGKGRLEELFNNCGAREVLIGNNICDNIQALENAKKCKNFICVVQLGKTSYLDLENVFKKCEYLNIKPICAITYSL